MPAPDHAPVPIEYIARVCHEANRGWCESIGDDSQASWDDAAPWQRESAIAGVRFAIENPESTPKQQHEAWCNDKHAAGWVFGPEKDADAKTHPCLVPYEKLPAAQRLKDSIFVAIVRALT